MNTSIIADSLTARTNPDCARQRAFNLACLGAKNVLELCVGPSLKVLEGAYKEHNINVIGNDIDPRWKDYYPQGNWRIGDALDPVVLGGTDTLVFAPPLSDGCTGRREDSLQIKQVNPNYSVFLNHVNRCRGIYNDIKRLCLVLPARSVATKQDRKQFYSLLTEASQLGNISVIELNAGRRKIRKYVDVYVELR